MSDSLDVSSVTARSGQGLRVLIADDEPDEVLTLGVLLRGAGFEVRTTHDGGEAIEAAREFLPQAALLDLKMPGGQSGHDVAQALRAAYGEACPVLIAVTACATAPDRARAKLSGFQYYFAKPFDPTQLINLLASLRAA